MSKDRSVALFDLDGTISRKDTYLAFLLHCLARRWHRWPRSAASLPTAVLLHKLNWKDNSWLKERFLAAILGGIERSALQRHVDQFLPTLIASGLNPGALQTIERHRARGDRLILASASFDFYVEPLARHLGMDTVICTKSSWDGNRLRGRLGGRNCYGPEKLQRVQAVLGEDGGGVIAYSDHHTDLLLLRWAEQGIAVNPSRKLRDLAKVHQLEIVDWRKSRRGER